MKLKTQRKIIEQLRRQYRVLPGVLEGTLGLYDRKNSITVYQGAPMADVWKYLTSIYNLRLHLNEK